MLIIQSFEKMTNLIFLMVNHKHDTDNYQVVNTSNERKNNPSKIPLLYKFGFSHKTNVWNIL